MRLPTIGVTSMRVFLLSTRLYSFSMMHRQLPSVLHFSNTCKTEEHGWGSMYARLIQTLEHGIGIIINFLEQVHSKTIPGVQQLPFSVVRIRPILPLQG